jgi:hypothetical protein
MTKNVKALLVWAGIVPVVAVIIAWPVLDSSSPDAGYALPFLLFFALVLIFVAAVIVGFATSTLKFSLLGVLLGLPLTFVVAIVIGGIAATREQIAADAQRKDLKQFLPAMHRGDRQTIVEALRQLRDTSVPVAVCILAESNEGPNATLLADDPRLNRNADYPFATDALLTLLEAVSMLDIPMAEKEAAFYSVLRTLPFRNDMASFPRWAALWDQLHAQTDEPARTRYIQITQQYDVHDDFCPWGDTNSLASSVIDYWDDAGIRMWLDTKHSFTTSQTRGVLLKVESPELLKELLALSIDINAPHPRADEGGYLSNSLLVTRAASFYQLINDSSSPDTVVSLVELMVTSGADRTSLSVTGESPCAAFLATEEYLDSTHPEVALAERKKAFAEIKTLLCK